MKLNAILAVVALTLAGAGNAVACVGPGCGEVKVSLDFAAQEAVNAALKAAGGNYSAVSKLIEMGTDSRRVSLVLYITPYGAEKLSAGVDPALDQKKEFWGATEAALKRMETRLEAEIAELTKPDLDLPAVWERIKKERELERLKVQFQAAEAIKADVWSDLAHENGLTGESSVDLVKRKQALFRKLSSMKAK
jgi:hypothetical protein